MKLGDQTLHTHAPGWPQQEGEWGVGAGGGDADGRGCCFRLAGGSQEALKPEPRESLPD